MTDTRIDEKALERAAEAIYDAVPLSLSEGLDEARAAITAYLAARAEAGFVEVPLLPTPKMVNATWEHPIDRDGGVESQNTRNARIYAAMLAKAK